MSDIFSFKKLTLYDVTSLTRTIDFRYPSNVFAVAMSAIGFITGIIIGAVEEKNVPEIVWLGIITALTVFVAWAITREIDPDHSVSAGLAAVLAWMGMIVWRQDTYILALYLMLVLARGVARTVGISLKITDMTALVVGAGIVAFSGAWLIGLVTAGGLILDSLLKNPTPAARIFGSLAVIVTVVIAVLTQNLEWAWRVEGDVLAGLLIIGAVYLWVTQTLPPPTATGDATGKPLAKSRVVAAQMLMLAGALAVYLWLGGDKGVFSMLSVWSAIIGMTIYSLYRKILS